MLSGRGLCDELITRPEESSRLCCVVVCDLETSRMGAPYIYDISRLRVKLGHTEQQDCQLHRDTKKKIVYIVYVIVWHWQAKDTEHWAVCS